MKTGHGEVVTVLLAAMILMDVFQVKAQVLDMADDAFDDEYQKCTDKMEIKYVPQLLKEEKANQQLLESVWENAKVKWEARKTRVLLPVNFRDNHGIALMAYLSEAQEQTPFYHQFSKAVDMAGQSRKDYIYSFQFKAFHFYLTRALQLLRRPCEQSYKHVVYSSRDTSFTFGGLNQARLGRITLAYSTKPQAATDHSVLTINTCFGVDVEKLVDQKSEKTVLIPMNEIFQVSQSENSSNLILQSTNKTCSHYECAFLGGLKTENCVENPEYLQPTYVYISGDENQKFEDPDAETQEPTQARGVQIADPFLLPGIKVVQPDEKPEERSLGNIHNPTPGPVPVPGPKTYPSASSGKMLLPPLGTFIIFVSAFAVKLFGPLQSGKA
uniref:NAD(P)(+)--arginine ADP-ribosyltransferase n=1 Tax=Oryctolagus cuniculus TaxID=9986 RepID=A0A5F9DFT4_RABIT